MSRRVTTTRLLELGEQLSDRERELIEIVDRLRLLSHTQLALLLDTSSSTTSQASAARIARRILARLVGDGILARLERRVGGIRAGSSGYSYYVGPVGQRLIAYWRGDGLTRGRFRPEPGGRYVRHRLAVSELYVQAEVQRRRGRLDLLAFESEPECWRTHLDGMGGRTILKPDAFVRIGDGAFEDSWFVEVDLGTESSSVIRRKLRAYLDYFHTGQEQATRGVFPRVLFAASSETRKAQLVDLCAALPEEFWALFVVTTLDEAVGLWMGNPH